MSSKIKLKIEGMHCTACAMSIDMDLEDLEGVSNVNTNYAKELTEIEFDSDKVSTADILRQIKKTGYNAIDETIQKGAN